MAILAEIPGRAHIKRCAGHGCIHLTYQRVTLHFSSVEDFVDLCRSWAQMLKQEVTQGNVPADTDDWGLELVYQNVRVWLRGREALEMGQLLRDALSRVSSLPPAGPLGDWPEGDAFIPIPDFAEMPRLAAGIEE